MTRRSRHHRLIAAAAGLGGLVLYLWPALRSPIVQWSDSRTDLSWAREGIGIFRPAQEGGHAAKPAYLLFLRTVLSLVPAAHNPRGIVIAQSVFLWMAIALVAWRLGRRQMWLGVTAYVLLASFLRLRDAASSIMTEALAAGLLLMVVFLLLNPLRTASAALTAGVLIGVLGLVRPNVGAIALVLAICVVSLRRAWRALLFALLGLVLVGVPLAILRAGHAQTMLNGLSFTMLEASADYYWLPSVGPLPVGTPREVERHELRLARTRWEQLLSQHGVDVRRQLVWRCLHGLLGLEFYDARWSQLYWWLTTLSRLASPLLLLCCIAVALSAPWGGDDRVWHVASALLLIMLIVQNFVLGPNPRFVLPMLPVLVVFAVMGAFQSGWRTASVLASSAVLVMLAFLVCLVPGVVDWQWGQIEAPGVALRQQIPSGCLPLGGTLHIRIAAPLVPTSAHLEVRGPAGQLLYDSAADARRTQPDIRIRIPEALSSASAAGPVDLRIVSRGSYDSSNYLLFPVVPPPWGRLVIREGTNVLSPSTGIMVGGLDWWTHRGWP